MKFRDFEVAQEGIGHIKAFQDFHGDLRLLIGESNGDGLPTNLLFQGTISELIQLLKDKGKEINHD